MGLNLLRYQSLIDYKFYYKLMASKFELILYKYTFSILPRENVIFDSHFRYLAL